MSVFKLCLGGLLILWLVSEFATEDISAVASLIGIALAVVVLKLFNDNNKTE